MTREIVITCAICAYRGTCQKKFRVQNALHCPEFCRDVTIKVEEEEQEEKSDEECSDREN